jgi:hypothetical protein
MTVFLFVSVAPSLCMNCLVGEYFNTLVYKALGKTKNWFTTENNLSHCISLKNWVCLVMTSSLSEEYLFFTLIVL